MSAKKKKVKCDMADLEWDMAGRASLKKGWSKLACEKVDLKEGRGFARQPGGTRFQPIKPEQRWARRPGDPVAWAGEDQEERRMPCGDDKQVGPHGPLEFPCEAEGMAPFYKWANSRSESLSICLRHQWSLLAVVILSPSRVFFSLVY